MSEVEGAVRLSDVAAEAGVSIATASRALNGSARKVRPALSERVLAAAERLNYAPNAQAQAMARGATDVVGLLVHDIADPYFSAIASGVSRAAESAGLLVMLGSTQGPEQELQYLNALRAQRGRAVILTGSLVDDAAHLERLAREVGAFERAGGRVVAVSQARLPVDTIVIENKAAATALAGALVDLGYQRFGVLAGPTGLLTARDRDRGFRDGLQAAEVAPPVVVHGAFNRDGGYEAMSELLDVAPDVDCVFAVADVMAVGALAACRSRGVRVPHDLGLAGFDDIATLRDVWPSLSTVRLPLEEIGAKAMDLVGEPSSATPRRRRVKGTVVLRDSTPGR